ncbi:MAG: phosphonoacetate hydrolase [Candidatus Aldehydirespiratoraceae bacterium]|jgi:phosphonoacetate hydrolase
MSAASVRAEEVLTAEPMAALVDSILRRTDDGGYRAASARGAVEFVREADGAFTITAQSGAHPLVDVGTNARLTVDAELGEPFLSLGDHPTPNAFESIAQYFDSPHAPDVVVLHAPTHRFHGNVGEHGSLATSQARAPFIAAGPGIVARGIVDEHLRTVDVAPTIAALLGCPEIEGHDGLGQPRSGIRLKVQDGDAQMALINPDTPPEHVVVFLWDGCNPQALHAAAARGEAPNIARLIERGTSYRHGAYASLPTATLANHITENTGVFPGRSGVLHNTWYDRERDEEVNLLDVRQMITARDHIRDDIETVHEALKRCEPDALSVATYEYADRGADWSSFAQMANGEAQAPMSEDERRRHRSTEYMGVPAFRNYSMFDAQSVADARYCWSGALGGLPRFSWFTLNLTDSIGHEAGPHSEIGHAAIRDTDARMGDIIDAIEAQGVLDKTAIIMCADHGMQATADGEAVDVSGPLRDAGIEHRMVDAQYVYLS